MNFPVSEIDVDQYNNHIFSLLQDDGCTIFIDTNIIALLYGIHDSARKEFLDWLKDYIVKERVKIPSWVINEYTNRFIRDKIQDYLSPLTKIKTIQKDFAHASAFLKMNIDEASLPKSKYGNLKEFQSDLKVIEEKIAKIAFAAAGKDQNYKLKIHNQIDQTFNKCILDSDIDDILGKINNLGLIRYYHKLPPGFQDDKKELNAHGDLILWYEILEHCKSKKIKKAILITNDEKKDWVYPPYKLKVNGRAQSNTEPQFKIVDPRLVAEFKIATTSEEFYIVNFEQLTKILISKISNSFIDLANALQIVHEQNEEAIKELSVQEPDPEVEAEEKVEDVKRDIPVIYAPESKPGIKLTYSKYATADRDFPLFNDDLFIYTIEKLKSHNWYVQNPAIDNFLSLTKKTIEENTTNREELFVVGRNIYQAAHGGSSSAMSFLQELREQFKHYNDSFINNIFAGMVYEIYFDSFGRFRGNKLKSHLINEVFNCEDLDRLKPAKEFIRSSLETYRDNLLYFPFEEQTITLIPTLNPEPIIEKNDWFGEKKYIELIDLKAGNIDLLSKNPDEQQEVYLQDTGLFGIIRIVSTIYAVPIKRIQLEKVITMESDLPVLLKDKKFRKLAKNN
jgi:hypothetical protein